MKQMEQYISKRCMAWDTNGPEVNQHDRKENLCKKDVFRLTSGMALSMTAIILVAFFLTKNIVVLWVGMALIVCAILWMLFIVQFLGMRLSNFTSELCQILDDMMNRSQEPENVSDRETIFARIHHRLVRLYNILQESNRKVEAERGRNYSRWCQIFPIR